MWWLGTGPFSCTWAKDTIPPSTGSSTSGHLVSIWSALLHEALVDVNAGEEKGLL